ncbi:MAG TPA: DNA primase [Pyrinomonadaceae bacterium]
MLYDQVFIDDLKNRADLVRIIEPYAPLKKKGANWMGCCPFHGEKTPSFSVTPSKGFYYCFGCQKSGTAISFVMEIEGLSYPEAIRRVAEISGIPLPEPVDDKKYEQNKKRREEKKEIAEQVIELNRYALEFWENHLQENNPHSKAAREYLEKREISAEIIKKFRIGFAPESWDAVMSLLKEKGADEKTIEASGLVSINEEKKRVYDRFRGRIMFPVLNVDGNPVAFGARILAQGEPKYLNSPETPAYVKGEHLYGLYQSKEEIRKKKYAILVEGYLDLIALYQFGVTNCVASLGTAFTEQQSKLLGRFARKVVVNYDGDKAGVKAARRAIETLLAEDFEIKVLVLPDGQDPDDYIRASGFAAYKKQHEQHAHTYLQFILEQVSKEYNINRPEQRQKAVDEMLPFISGVQNLVQKRTVFDEIMGFLRVDKSVSSDLWKSLRVNQKVDSKLLKRILPKMTVAEQRLLELLIYDKDLREIILPQIEETDYEGLATAAVFRALVEIDRRNAEISLENLMEVIGDDEMANDFVPVLMLSESPRETGEALDEVLIQAENCVATLREMAISNRILEISQELMLAEQSGNDELLGQLVGEQIDLARMKHELQNRLVEN